MTTKLPLSLTEAQADAVTKSWEVAGYVFSGNGFLDRDDPPECPMCGETGYFYALWEHPTLRTSETGSDGEVYSYKAAHCFMRCYECGYEWVDEETM